MDAFHGGPGRFRPIRCTSSPETGVARGVTSGQTFLPETGRENARENERFALRPARRVIKPEKPGNDDGCVYFGIYFPKDRAFLFPAMRAPAVPFAPLFVLRRPFLPPPKIRRTDGSRVLDSAMLKNDAVWNPNTSAVVSNRRARTNHSRVRRHVRNCVFSMCLGERVITFS